MASATVAMLHLRFGRRSSATGDERARQDVRGNVPLISSVRSHVRLSAVLAWSARAQAVLFFFVVLGIYGLTANYGLRQNDDIVAMAVPLWRLLTSGTLDVAPYQEVADWFIDVDGRVLSNRWPGTMLFALPAYAIATPFLDVSQGPVLWPATVTAVIVGALAATMLFTLVFIYHGPTTAWIAGAVGGMGTGFWTVAADGLWTHAPAVFLSLLALHALRKDMLWAAGCCFGVLALVRPHLLVVAALVGYILARERRDAWIIVKIGVPAALGLALYVTYASVLAGGVSTGIERYAFTPPEGWQRLVFVLGFLFAPRVGLLIYTPVLICSLAGLRLAWAKAVDWQHAAFIGGAVYLVIQLQLNSYLGGYGLYGYRLPLETLAFGSPLLIHGAMLFARRSRRHAALSGALAAFSVWISAVGAFLFVGRIGRVGSWYAYEPVLTLASRPLPVAVAAVVLGLVAVLSVAWLAAAHHSGAGVFIAEPATAPTHGPPVAQRQASR